VSGGQVKESRLQAAINDVSIDMEKDSGDRTLPVTNVTVTVITLH